MKKLFKWIQETLFGKKDALSEPCKNVYKELEKVKSSYISNEEFNSLTTEQQKAVIEQEISDVELQMNITLGNGPYLMGTSLDYKTGQPLVRERPLRTAEDGEDFISSVEQLLKNQPSQKPSKELNDKLTNIHFFTPEDNKKETVLNEKKASEIKKKRQYKKKKK